MKEEVERTKRTKRTDVSIAPEDWAFHLAFWRGCGVFWRKNGFLAVFGGIA
jgi:hypothetical protein